MTPEKRSEVKGKGQKERYTNLNGEFQRIAGQDKKAFFSDQCKEKEENNRMGKTRDLFKKIRDTKVPGASVRNSAHGKGHEEGGFGICKGRIEPQETPCS